MGIPVWPDPTSSEMAWAPRTVPQHTELCRSDGPFGSRSRPRGRPSVSQPSRSRSWSPSRFSGAAEAAAGASSTTGPSAPTAPPRELERTTVALPVAALPLAVAPVRQCRRCAAVSLSAGSAHRVRQQGVHRWSISPRTGRADRADTKRHPSRPGPRRGFSPTPGCPEDRSGAAGLVSHPSAIRPGPGGSCVVWCADVHGREGVRTCEAAAALA